MIKGLYETHLYVENLEISVNFYKNMPGLELCHFESERKAAFFWIGQPQQAMLGIWETPKNKIRQLHIAFRCDKDDIVNKSHHFFEQRNLNPYNFLNDGTATPMVFCWMPALSIYFDDPDGHTLEFIAVLEGKPIPEAGIVSYEKWIQLQHDVHANQLT